ncbi:hypothetical protein HYFRA_00000288 [Hymenoscyphus fraxineus]|uniref:Uncharacterized protein n=1 Tax=Hymenoscyphus fraxineus TaxID=746836 RepID=A0A9N9L3K0_9HELO|nr:hypothetical protein HYFRA_00000288 [Hymenoscyphus fraxineus]
MGSIAVAEVDLDKSWQDEGVTVVEVRTSGMKDMRGMESVQTGIYKETRGERVWCGAEGLEGDEHDLTFHGGPDKALHQYYPGHYPLWRAEFPHNNGSFQPGGFGENLITSGTMNERNVCIGDIISIGSSVLLQVSLPRQPCFKLNSRFGLKNFAPNTWRLSRTGWYYRVLRQGWVQVGDEVRLVERKWGSWTIERVQEYLHRDTECVEMLEELLGIEEFGGECKKAFRRLLKRAREKDVPKKKEIFKPWVLKEKSKETVRVSRFVLERVGNEEGEVQPGSFVRLRLPGGMLRSYSIVDGTRNQVVLGIAREEKSRGGSVYLHDSLAVGDEVMVGNITASVPFREQCSKHVFLVGGIGITAFLPHAKKMQRIHLEFTIHFAVRSWEELPFKKEIRELGDRVRVYDASKGERMDIENVIKERGWNSFLYVCGPDRMIEGVRTAAQKLGVGDEDIHYEAFAMDVGGDPFTVSVKGDEKKRVVSVGQEESLLEALKREGWAVDSSCEVGNCGTCQVRVCEGRVEHRGSGLSEMERKEGVMLSCVSRGVGGAHLVVEF